MLERDCTPADFAKKSAKLAGKRAGAFQRVPYMLALGMKRRALAHKEMPEWEEMCAVAAAVQNIYLAATAAGVAGVAPVCTGAGAARLAALHAMSLPKHAS